ncbi:MULTISPECIES: NADPH-dependent FMN reductase [Pseudofrankia]|uniref:NADPH-dependent FMN reductase n=1 Tax=Pseudofrankia TaxID=2994363 RepID=UPI000234CD36|nr:MULTISPECIES: NAD(P)H-dependent oxidoreductase [Pseudofrankia]OHV41547.1 NADPH-dependent FMN reductase [Pseudofrankia sp. EUN1h]
MPRLQIIVGSTRPTRAADLVVPWVVSEADACGRFDQVEVLDLRDWPLPIFAEHFGTIGDFADPTYSAPVVKAWNDKIKEGDAYLVITTEYNHSIPGVLKNALDSVWVSFGFRNKPVASVGYSAGISGAIRAIEHLAQIFVEAEAVPLRNSVVLPAVSTAFGDDGRPVDPMARVSLDLLLEDLEWWADVLRSARAQGEPAPSHLRVQTGLAALTEPASR